MVEADAEDPAFGHAMRRQGWPGSQEVEPVCISNLRLGAVGRGRGGPHGPGWPLGRGLRRKSESGLEAVQLAGRTRMALTTSIAGDARLPSSRRQRCADPVLEGLQGHRAEPDVPLDANQEPSRYDCRACLACKLLQSQSSQPTPSWTTHLSRRTGYSENGPGPIAD